MGACTACRTAKVKCEQVFPCKRCQRLGVDCIPHQSRQGQNSRNNKKKKTLGHKRARLDNDNATAEATNDCPGEQTNSEDAAISCKMIQDPSVNKNHYGLNYLIRSWIALALKRRSFSLLGRAANMAVQCGISMDDVLCEMNGQRGMDFIYPFLLTPLAEQTLIGSSPLTVSEIPTSLWSSIGIRRKDPQQPESHKEEEEQNRKDDNDCFSKVEDAIQDRWIFVRTTNKGVVRFYCTPAFEKNIATRHLIEETYKENKQHVSTLYLSTNAKDDGEEHDNDGSAKKNMSDTVLGFAHQIALHSKPGIVTQPTRQSNVRLKVKTMTTTTATTSEGSGDGYELIFVDIITVLVLPSVDCCFVLSEFIHHNNNDKAGAKSPTICDQNNNNGSDTTDEPDLHHFQSLFDDVEAIDSDDAETKFIHDLLSNY